MRALLAFPYRLFFGLPPMFLGYVKDQLSLKKNAQDQVCANLRQSGLHIFEDKLPAAALEQLLQDFEELKANNALSASGQLNGRIYAEGALSPLLAEYAKKIEPYAKSFIGTERIKLEISYYQESFPTQTVGDVPGGEFHVDDNKANLKYFIYLSDVGEENGPFSCVPATGSWKLKGSIWRGIFWELTKQRKYLYNYLINNEHCVGSEKKIMGPAGTTFLVDTTSLHRAQPVLKGYRKVAVISFNRDGIL